MAFAAHSSAALDACNSPLPAPFIALQVVESELIHARMGTLVEMENSGMVCMLQQDQYADLARMFSLFKRVDGGVDLLKKVCGAGVRCVREAILWDFLGLPVKGVLRGSTALPIPPSPPPPLPGDGRPHQGHGAGPGA
jgi:hypothetical protein